MRLSSGTMNEPLAHAALRALDVGGHLAYAVVEAEAIAHASTGFAALFGLAGTGEALGPWQGRVVEEDRERVGHALAAAQGAARPTSFRGLRAEGSQFEAALLATAFDGPHGRAVVMLVTDESERLRAETQLTYLAFLDPLTGLPNRARFLDRLRQGLIDARASGRGLAVLLGDLDGFKGVNDAGGHEAGDAVLQAVAQRLRRGLRGSDTLARLGGDEFALLLPGVARNEDAALVAGRLVQSLASPIENGAARWRVGISVGIAMHPRDGADMDTLVARADAAMYAAKREGKSRYAFADGEAGASQGIRFVEWSDHFAVGIPIIDEQHEGIVERVNRLGNDMKAGHGVDRLAQTLGELVACTRQHFATEEALMDRAGLDEEAIRHRQVHQRLLDDVQSLSINLDGRSMVLTMRYLQEWLLRHVEYMDRPLAVALKERGVG